MFDKNNTNKNNTNKDNKTVTDKNNDSFNFKKVVSNLPSTSKSTPWHKNNVNKVNKVNKDNNSFNFKKIVSNSTSPNGMPWYKKKASIIAMSSTLGVGVLATAIAVPVALLSNTSSTDSNADKPSLTIDEKVDIFNSEPLAQKITNYNKMITTEFQQAVNTSWLYNAQNIITDDNALVNSPFYKYVINNIDPSTLTESTPLVKAGIIQYLTYTITPPTGNSKILTNIDNFFKLISVPGNFFGTITIETPKFEFYNFNSLLMSQIIELKIMGGNNSFSISINANNSNSNFNFFDVNIQTTSNNIGVKQYKVNPTYILNDEYTNNLLSPLIIEFINKLY